MTYVFTGILAVWLGYLVGQQPRWSRWHGPVAAVIVVPLAMHLGFDPLLSLVGPPCLATGFMIAKATV